MSVSVTVNATSYTIPQTSENNWGAQVTAWIQAISSNTLQKNGGSFTLTNEVDFGNTYGVKSAYFKSRSSNVSDSGNIRLSNTDAINWRNIANSANLSLKPNTSTDGILTYNSVDLVNISATQALTNKSIDAASNTLTNISNANISASAAIAYSKLNLTGAILNADLAGGIAYSKLALTGSIINADVSNSAAIAYSKLNLSGAILNADLAGSIAYSKLSLAGSILNADLAGSIAASKLIGTDIATVGTITSGTWSGTTIALNKGGTGQTTKAAAFDALSPNSTTGDLTYYSGSTNSRLAVGASGTVMKSVGGIPTWSAFSGGINYASSNPDAEADTSGWATYADGAAIPVDGTGGSPSGTFTRSTSSPLRGSASFLYTAGALGNGASYAFTIDSADQAKNLQISFDYSVSGTLTTGDYTVYVYDVTNAVLTQVIPYQLSGTTGTQYSFKGTYQTASNSTSYRLIINQAVASPGGNLKLDNIYIGPQGVSYTAPVTDWIAYTPSYTNLSIGNGAASWFYRRVGDSIQLKGSIGFGTTTSVTGAITISLPSGLSIDSNKLEGDGGLGSGATRLGVVNGIISTRNYVGTLYFNSSTSFKIFGDNYTSAGSWAATVPATWASGNQIQVTPTNTIPIAGWSSSAAVSQSDSSEGRVVVATYQTSGAGAINSTPALLTTGWVGLVDTFSSFDTSTGRYTVKVSGNYKVSCSFSLGNAAYTLNQKCNAFIYVNGVSIARLAGLTAQAAATFGPALAGSLTVPVNAGDIVDVRVSSDVASNLSGTLTNNTVSFELVPGNQSIMASESVGARVSSSNGPSIGTSIAIVKFNAATYDSHGSYDSTTGLYTCRTLGKFSVSAFITPGAVTLSTSQTLIVQLFKNGVRYSDLDMRFGNGTSQNYRAGGSDEVSCVPGDTLEIWASCSVAGTLAADPKTNYAVFRRVGN